MIGSALRARRISLTGFRNSVILSNETYPGLTVIPVVDYACFCGASIVLVRNYRRKGGEQIPHTTRTKFQSGSPIYSNILPAQDMVVVVVVVVVNLAFNLYRHSNPLILEALSPCPTGKIMVKFKFRMRQNAEKKSTGDLISRVTQRPHWHPSGINKINNIKNKNKKTFSPKTVALPWLIQCIQFSFFPFGKIDICLL